jgi:hypothetical protein
VLNPADVMKKLEGIEEDLAKRIGPYETAAADFYRAKRDYERAFAEAYVAAEGSNQKERESRAVIAIWKGEAYTSLIVAEAAYEAQKAAHRVLDTRASIGMALLKAMSLEARDLRSAA